MERFILNKLLDWKNPPYRKLHSTESDAGQQPEDRARKDTHYL